MAWELKRKPEDFIVDEILDDVTIESWKDKMRGIHGRGGIEVGKNKDEKGGKYLWMTLRKHDTGFFKAIDLLARGLNISTRSISYSNPGARPRPSS